ncbi:MAG TPA: cupin domain-containing protein [Candidatus Binatia bacterium]|jgi:anti-sigma factor ChrR (cupin superfamily)
MTVLRHSIAGIASILVDEKGLDRLSWRDFGNGLSMARLAREGQRELVVYRVAAGAASDVFLRHEHVGGEFYLVLKGAIADETGSYGAGEVVYLDPKSVHTPRARSDAGETVILVLWPEGVTVLE